MSIIIFIIVLLVLVLVHEAGHFSSAKFFGIKVEEFGFGFPPKLFGIKKGETEYTLNLLPIGGFVRIFGEDPSTEEEISGPDAQRSFVNKPKWQQAVVLFAGIISNLLLAWVLFSISLMYGMPTSVENAAGYKVNNPALTIVSVITQSPASAAGLRTGDKIVSIKNDSGMAPSVTTEAIQSYVTESAGKEVDIGYLRGNSTEINTAKIFPEESKTDHKYEIGISMDEIGTAKLSFFPALWNGLRLDWNATKQTVVGLYMLIYGAIHGKGSLSDVAGPVGMVGIVGDAMKFGFSYLLSFTALISINLAVINLIPFPALDGGRLLFLLIEKIKGSRIDPKIANTVNSIGFGVLLLLMLVITYHDVIKLF